MTKVLVRESFGSEDSTEVLYVQNKDQMNSLTIVDKQTNGWLTLSSIKMFFTSVFLPSGYPESVSDDYIEYQLWDSIQAFASSIMNNLGTHSILRGVGVGDSSATVLAATITWFLRDGTSMSGRILFAYIQSSKLDSDCKKWRLFADLMNDVSIFVDLLSPYFSNHFLYMQCLSGVMKSLVGTAGGATRAALTQHQARRNNMADVSAKDGSQETLVNLMALFCSLILVPVVADYSNLVWLLFVSFTVLHIYANYRAVKCVSIEIFNVNRFANFVEHYLINRMTSLATKPINRRENVWFFCSDRFDVYSHRIKVGVTLRQHLSEKKKLEELIHIYSYNKDISNKKCGYILSRDHNKRILISLNKESDSLTVLESVFQAIIICFAQNNIETNFESETESKFGNSLNFVKIFAQNDEKKLLEWSRKLVVLWFDDMLDNAKKNGWDLSRLLIIPNEWRFQIKD